MNTIKRYALYPFISYYFFSYFFLSTAFAHAHTWHDVSSLQGRWTAKLVMLNQNGYFVDTSNATISGFKIKPSEPATYGFNLLANDTFDVAYALSIVQEAEQRAFVSKACLFLITATAPAKPDIRITAYNGAKCHYVTNGQHPGGNFEVG